jgi:hypothetical protein
MVGFAWSADQNLKDYQAFKTVAACGWGPIQMFDKLYIPKIIKYLKDHDPNFTTGVLMRTDTGGGLCSPYFTLDLFVGESLSGKDGFLELMRLTDKGNIPQLVRVYKKH